MKRRNLPHSQRGVTLIVALIMLVALAMLAIWAFNSSTTNLRVVGNTQARQEALAAAQAAVEQTISSPLFMFDAAAVAAAPIPVDVDGDDVTDYDARLTPSPSCFRVRVYKVSELDPANAGDRNCFRSGGVENSGIEVEGAAPPSGDSMCADSQWNVRAVVNDPRSNASVAVNQGVAARSLTSDTEDACK